MHSVRQSAQTPFRNAVNQIGGQGLVIGKIDCVFPDGKAAQIVCKPLDGFNPCIKADVAFAGGKRDGFPVPLIIRHASQDALAHIRDAVFEDCHHLCQGSARFFWLRIDVGQDCPGRLPAVMTLICSLKCSSAFGTCPHRPFPPQMIAQSAISERIRRIVQDGFPPGPSAQEA